jgi:ribosomal protein S6--L-glutamate ligase
MNNGDNKKILGCQEWLKFETIDIPAIKARVDSGAKTSSLHAFNISSVEEDGKQFVRFYVNPIQNNKKVTIKCKAPLLDRRIVRSSSGDSEKRYVIKVPVTLGVETWDIEVTLTNRDSMGYRMLLGREAMRGRYIVDPEKHFRMGKYSDEQIKAFYNVQKTAKKKLRIALLASNPELFSNKRIMEAGSLRGHEMIFVNIQQCYMNVSSESSAVHYRGGEALYDIDAVIPRIKPAVTAYGCAVLRHFEHLGAFCLNDALAISRSRDKLRALQTMVAKGIDTPITGFADSPLDTKDLIKMVGGAPLVIKLLEGTQGKGVVLADTMSAAESVINAFKSLKANILVQEFIKEADGKDLRCFVIDGKVVGAIERKAKKGEFRANLHLGGTATEAKISPEEKRMAIKASKGLGLVVAGVDIIRSKSGPRILEVNSSPGLEGIETYTGKDIAGMMIDAIEKQFE